MNKVLGADIQNLPLVVGVDLGGIQIRAAVLRGNQLISEVGLLIGADSTPELVIPRICSAIQLAVKKANATYDQIAAIGVGVPGPVNSDEGIAYFMPNLSGWDHDVPLRDRLAEHFNRPIYIENDANAAALGEYLFGAGRGCNFMVYLTISTGLGGSVIINGQVMRGISGAAMEIGHMTIHEFGELCHCGNIGCLETVASGIAIVHHANEALKFEQGGGFLALKHNARMQDESKLSTHDQIAHEHDEDEPDWLPSVDAKAVAEAAEAGVPAARAIIKNAAEALGVGLVNIIHIFNPEKIILGGSLTQIGRPMLIDPAIKIVQERAMAVQREAVSIEEAQLGMYAGLVGAGAVVYHNRGISIQASQQKP